MRVGRLDKYVALYRGPVTSGDSDGWAEALTPSHAWVRMQPQGPTADGRGVEHAVTMRFHPQVTMDAILVYSDPKLGRDRTLVVRGFRNVDEQNDELQLIADEVIP